jgi:DHA1 family tetracycline resistance protein-like MFS transporter
VSLLFAVMLHPHAARRGQRHAGFWTLPRRAPRYLRWLLFGAGFALIQGVAQPFVVPYWRNIGHLSVETIGWLGSATILAATLAGPLWGRLADRLGYVKSLGIGLAATAAGWIVLALWPASVGLGLAGAVLRGTEEGCSTVAGSAVGRTVGSDRAGTAYGLYNLASELARAAGPVPGGLAYEGRPPIPFLASAFLTAAIAWLFLDTLPEGSPPPRA